MGIDREWIGSSTAGASAGSLQEIRVASSRRQTPRFAISAKVLVILCIALGLCPLNAEQIQTNLAVIVRHAPSLNGGVIQGSLQQLTGESLTVNGGFAMTGDLLLPGTPTLVQNGHPVFAGTIAGSGSASPSGYQVILNGNCSLNYLRTRTAPLSLPTIANPPAPSGTRVVAINKSGQSYGDAATLRDLTLNGNVGMISVPPGTYGNFTLNGGSGLVIGVAGGGQAVNYNLQNLTLNGNSTLKIVGPVILTVANGFAANGQLGASNNPAWLQLHIANGNFTLNGGCNLYGQVAAPNGTVTINGNSLLVGTSASDRFILNGAGQVRWSGAAQIIQPPVAANQSLTLAENSSINIILTGTDPQGLPLAYSVLTPPAHGTLSGTPPQLTYLPATNYFGNDAFTFKANNGIADSAPATVSLTVTQVYYPPVANPQNLTNLENTALVITLSGSDPQGYSLSYSVVTQPAHGALTGAAPHLTYLPATNYWGSDTFTFRANDGVSNSAVAAIAITNQPVDRPPLVIAGPDQLIILPTNTVALAGSVTYADFPGTVDIVRWSQVSGPGTIIFSQPSTLNPQLTFSTNGIYTLQLWAGDSFLSASNSLCVIVDAPPVVDAGASITNTFPGTIALQGTASDDGLPTNGTLSIRWSIVSGPGTVIFSQPTTLNPQLTASTNGIYIVRLTADDGVATNHSDVTLIENRPPTVSAGGDILTNGLETGLKGSASDDGLPGNNLAVQWTQSGGPGAATFGNATSTNTTVTVNQSGTYVLTLTASDGAASKSSDVTVTFNLRPTVSAGPEQIVNFGDTITLQGSATDDQLPHNILNILWSEVEGQGTVTFADAAATNTTVTFDQPGIYTLRLTADDGMAVGSADTIVAVNAAPVVNAGPNQTVTLGTAVTLAGTVTDDGIPGPDLTTEWSETSGPAEATITDATALNTSVNFSAAGVYAFQLTANDGLTNGSAQMTITVLPVSPANHAPVAQSQSVSTVSNTAVNITLSATDADNDALTYQVLTQPANGTLGGAAPNLIYQPAADFIGCVSFTFIANDGQVDSAPATVSIAVNMPPNNPPQVSIVNPLDASQVQSGQAITIETHAGDLDGQITNVTVLADHQELAEFTALPFTATWTGATLGKHVVLATATDNRGATSVSLPVCIWVVDESGDFVVDAGPDQIISLPGVATLAGTVEIQTPVAGSQTNVTWSKLDGPGDVEFSDINALTTTAQFNEAGSYTLRLEVAYGSGTRSDLLTVDVLPPPSSHLTAARSNRGTDFWLTFLVNASCYYEPTYMGRDLYISADVDTDGSSGFLDGNQEQHFHVKAGSVMIVQNGDWGVADLGASDCIQSNAIHVTADRPVTVNGLNYIDSSSDGFLALPTAMLGTDYIVLSYRNSPSWYDENEVSGGTQFAVVASENDTVIVITPSFTTGSRQAGVPYQIILQQGETYRLINYDEVDADLTGTTIKADKPIAVFAGHQCGYVPTGIGYANHMVEEMTPVDTWGCHFVTMPFAGRLYGDTFRFLAATNGTHVAINGHMVATLDRGQFYEQIIDVPAEILASQPILVAQYSHGQMVDGQLGDPSMTLIPPVEDFGGSCALSTPSFWYYPSAENEDIFTNFLNLTVRTNGMGLIQLDGDYIPANQFQVISNSGYAGLQLAINSGTHHLSATTPFGACLYGWAWCDAYAFWNGIYSETAEPDSKLELTQVTSFAAVGSEKSVYARVANGRNLPVADLELGFSVLGANAATGRVLTSRLGEALFSYTGANAGPDIITASLADLHQSVTNLWIAGSDNLPPLVSTDATATNQFSRTLELAGSVSDDNRPAGGSLHVHWQLLDGPAGVQFENAAQTVTRAFCPQSGRYVFDLSADDGQFSSHASVAVAVDDLPEVEISDGFQLPSVASVGSTIQLSADAGDDDGMVDRVEFYANDSLIGTATHADSWQSYTADWVPATNGWFQIRAVAFDNQGGSNTVSLGMIQVGYLPQVFIDSPIHDAVLTVPTNVYIHATACDVDEALASISIYADGDLLGTSNGPEITAYWFPRQEGNHTLTAVATDSLGLSTSRDVPVTVAGVFPHVTIINNYTNRWGSEFIRIPLCEPALLQPDISIPEPYQVTNVDFYVLGSFGENEWIGSKSQPPYQIVWTPQNGDYLQLQVIAESDSGAIGEDTAWLQYYWDISVAFASPTTNQTVTVGRPTPIQLSVRDPGSIIGTFDYYVNGQLLVETNSDTILWTPPAPGNYQLCVYVIERLYGQWIATECMSIDATVATPINSVWIVSPMDGQESYAGVSLPIAVDFADSAGIFGHLEVFTNGISLGTATNGFFDWTPIQTNDYTLTARVFDVLSNTYDAANSVTVHIIPPPRPVITITTPRDGSRVQANAETTISASLNDPASLTTNVQFFADGVRVSDDTISCGWTPTGLGSHLLQALALTSDGDCITSAPVNVTVAVLHPPVVALLSPTNEQRFPSDQQPFLMAQVSDADGTISNLTISLDSTTLAITNGPVLGVLMTNAAAGWHDAAANALDNDGLSSSSGPVRFYLERREDTSLPVPDGLTAEASSSAEIELTWYSIPINEHAQSILIERWDNMGASWIELGETSIGNSSFNDSNLNPETNYRYRIACVDSNGVRSPYSSEAGATTHAVLPNYAAVDLSEAIATSITNSATANILTNAGLDNFDSRRSRSFDAQYVNTILGTNAAPLLEAVARFKEQWPQIQLDYDPALLSPKSILPRLGFLTGPDGSGITVPDSTAVMFDPNDPYRPVKAFVQKYRDLFCFGPDAISNAVVQRDYISPPTGARTVVWQEQVAGIPVFNALLAGNITTNGELASIACEFIPTPANAADASLVSQVLAGGSLPFSGAQAVLAAVTNVGDVLDPSDFSAQTDPRGIVRSQGFTATRGFKQNAGVELTWFPASRNELKLAWQVIFTSQWRGEMYLTLVSALDGQILYRRNLTADSSDASYQVYTDASPAPMWPGLPVPGTNQPAFVNRSVLTFSALDTNASPGGWINDGDDETRGNNVDAHLDRDDDDNPDLPRPTGNPWRTFNFALDPAAEPESYGDAAVVQLFFWNNWMHDTLYQLGFTEAAGNFQNDNFGRGGYGGDSVQADAQDGFNLNDSRHRNNANMSTPPDGYAPRMQMYVFDGPTPARDGSLDAEIVLHEYTHGLSSRLVGGGAGIDALQSAGMGEGWSDFYALSLLANPTNDVDGAYPIGGYLAYHAFGSAFAENYYYGLRHYPYCTDTNRNPLTFADIDPSCASPHPGVPRSPLMGPFSAVQAGEVHNQGEVWCSMLWELRANLVGKYGPEPGNGLVLQLVTDGLRLSPANPNFVQARDAILLADRIYSGGANGPEIWGAFAKRGLGFDATAPESYTSTGTRESHGLQPALAAQQVEIQSVSGSIEPDVVNGLAIHLRNQGNAAATHVGGHLSTTVPGVSVLQSEVVYSDIPPGGEDVSAVAFQIQTDGNYVSGTPIDLELTVTSDQGPSVNHLRLYSGAVGGEILFDDYNALAKPESPSSAPKDLTPWDIGNAEPLWMADDDSCLLKAGSGKYILWKPGGAVQTIVNGNFLAHRLTHNGIVVGTLKLPDEVVTGCKVITTAGNVVTNVCWISVIPHSEGVWWDFTTVTPVPLTSAEYRWPIGAGPLASAGNIYSAVIPDQSGNAAYLGNIFTYPTLQDVWDMDRNGVAVGAASFQGAFNQLLYFDTLGNMDWFAPVERGLDAGNGGSNYWTAVDFFALTTSAAQFNSPENWRWLGPLNWNTPTSYATLINDAGMVAGAATVDLNDPNLNAQRPMHAFRAPLTGECQPFATFITDLGALTGGLHSFPRAMNAEGDLVGYSDFDATTTGGLNFSPFNSHAVYWSSTDTAPEWLTNYPPSATAAYGFGDAYGINDSNQIVGASVLADGRMVGVLWQQNENTNGIPFWEITDLNDRLGDSSWQVFRAVDINNDGLILAHASDANGIKHAVLLVPMSMAVDNNRDGNITFDDADRTTADKPYRFWINDSTESGDISDAADEVPGQSVAKANYHLGSVNGRSDLVNFFPVAMNLELLLHIFPLEKGFEYHLSQEGQAVKFVYTRLAQEKAFNYLTDVTAESGYGLNADRPPQSADALQILKSGSHGTKLDASWLAQVQGNGGVGIILMEGGAKTTDPLVLEIWRNSKRLGVVSLCLSIDGVENMYRHLNLRDGPDAPPTTPDPNGLAGQASSGDWSRASKMDEPAAFPDFLKNNKWLIYIHGYNVSGQEARGRESEVFKRFYWSGNKARFVGVGWFGDPYGGDDDYLADYQWAVMNAFATAPKFAEIIGRLEGPKTVVAHSLGNMLVSSAINDYGLVVDHFCMIDAAVAMEAFKGDMPADLHNLAITPWVDHTGSSVPNYPMNLWASEWHNLFPASDHRSGLTWRGRFTGTVPVIYNFYSSTENVLAPYVGTPSGSIISMLLSHPSMVTGRYAWEVQEKTKGRKLDLGVIKHVRGGSDYGGWGFNIWDGYLPGYPTWYVPLACNCSRRVKNPTEIGTITEDLLNGSRYNPLFNDGWGAYQLNDASARYVNVDTAYFTGPNWIMGLYDPVGGDTIATAPAKRAQLLAQAIPALTLPAGANYASAFVYARNFDMPAQCTADPVCWPSTRGVQPGGMPNWFHGDYCDVAYPNVHKLFDQIIDISQTSP